MNGLRGEEAIANYASSPCIVCDCHALARNDKLYPVTPVTSVTLPLWCGQCVTATIHHVFARIRSNLYIGRSMHRDTFLFVLYNFATNGDVSGSGAYMN